jgi:hypothetical protein
MCHDGELPALLLDAGIVDLRVHFGLNLSPAETVKMQRKTTCNVLPMENRIVERGASWWAARGFRDSKTTIEYGTFRNTDPSFQPEATFLQTSALTAHQKSYGLAAAKNHSWADDTAIGINTIPEMQRSDADVGMAAVWLNDVTYETPVNDPLFSAHREWGYTPGGGVGNITEYKSDYVAGVIGCSQQVPIHRHRSIDIYTKTLNSTDTAFYSLTQMTFVHL